MQKILDFFQKKAMLKVFIAFFLVVTLVWLYLKTDKIVFGYIALVPGAYIAIFILIAIWFAIKGSIQDVGRFRKR